ncbi:MAG TPA: hypothetical protein VGV61_16650, partial [Thermoanaerobaculia bacterium]|nr:hypothetical protein [Thermoanaerobaculia bacterium]
MSETVDPAAPPARYSRVYGGALLAAGGLAAIALLGWVAGLPRLADFRAGWVPMAPNTALCLLLLAVAAALAERPWGQRPAIAAALAAALLSVTRVVEYLAPVELDVDRWFFRFAAGNVGLAPVGRMALFTALALAASSAAVLLFAWPGRRRWSEAMAGVLGAAVALEGLAFTIGYLHNGPLDRDAQGIPMALPTAMALTALGGALALRSAVAGVENQRRLELATRRSEDLF